MAREMKGYSSLKDRNAFVSRIERYLSSMQRDPMQNPIHQQGYTDWRVYSNRTVKNSQFAPQTSLPGAFPITGISAHGQEAVIEVPYSASAHDQSLDKVLRMYEERRKNVVLVAPSFFARENISNRADGNKIIFTDSLSMPLLRLSSFINSTISEYGHGLEHDVSEIRPYKEPSHDTMRLFPSLASNGSHLSGRRGTGDAYVVNTSSPLSIVRYTFSHKDKKKEEDLANRLAIFADASKAFTGWRREHGKTYVHRAHIVDDSALRELTVGTTHRGVQVLYTTRMAYDYAEGFVIAAMKMMSQSPGAVSFFPDIVDSGVNPSRALPMRISLNPDGGVLIPPRDVAQEIGESIVNRQILR